MNHTNHTLLNSTHEAPVSDESMESVGGNTNMIGIKAPQKWKNGETFKDSSPSMAYSEHHYRMRYIITSKRGVRRTIMM